MFRVGPGLIFSASSTAKRAVAVRTGTTAGLGPVPNFWGQFYNKVIVAEFQVCFSSVLHPRYPLESWRNLLYAHVTFRFFVPFEVWPQAVLFILLLAGFGRPAAPPVRSASDRARYLRSSRRSVRLLPACSHTARRRDTPGGRKMMIHQDRLPISPKTGSLEIRKKKRETNSMNTARKCTTRHRTRS